MKKTLETQIKKQIKDWLNIKQIFSFHLLQALGCFKGVPDRIILYKGQAIFCEIKTPTGKQSEHQRNFQDLVEKNGCIYIVARGYEDIEKVILALDKQK